MVFKVFTTRLRFASLRLREALSKVAQQQQQQHRLLGAGGGFCVVKW
jgi:hypothetical protein